MSSTSSQSPSQTQILFPDDDTFGFAFDIKKEGYEKQFFDFDKDDSSYQSLPGTYSTPATSDMFDYDVKESTVDSTNSETSTVPPNGVVLPSAVSKGE